MFHYSINIFPEHDFYRQVRNGIEKFWWQDREMFILSFNKGNRLWRHFVVHHSISGTQIGYVRWWYSQEDNPYFWELYT